MATTILAGTLRLLLTSISYRAKARKEIRREPPVVPRRPPHPCRWTDRRVECVKQTRRALTADRCQIASRRADLVQVETLTPQQVRRVQHLPAIHRRQELTPPGWYGLRSVALSGMDP